MEHNFKIVSLNQLDNWESNIHQITKDVIQMDFTEIEGLTEEDEGTVEQWERIFPKTADILFILYDGDKVIGYMNSVILKDEYTKILKAGNLKDSEISEKMIMLPKKGDICDIYVISMAINSAYQKLGLGDKLLKHLDSKIVNMENEGIKVNSIIGNAFSKKGKKFLEKNNFVKLCDHINSGEIVIKYR